MKISISYLVIFFIVTFSLGIILGYFLRDNLRTINQILPKSCQYNGITYKEGDSFPATDGCNNCGCDNGGVTCTMMACYK